MRTFWTCLHPPHLSTTFLHTSYILYSCMLPPPPRSTPRCPLVPQSTLKRVHQDLQLEIENSTSERHKVSQQHVSLTNGICLSLFPSCLSLCHLMSTRRSLPHTVFPNLSFFLCHSSTCLSIKTTASRCSRLLLLLPLGPSLSKCVAAQGLCFLSLWVGCCLTERSASKCDRTVKRWTCTQAHADTHTHALALSPQRNVRVSALGLMKLLRQIRGRNSICRGDELCDRVEREERRMKGQEEKRSRVAAPGLIVHYDSTLSSRLSAPLHRAHVW